MIKFYNDSMREPGKRTAINNFLLSCGIIGSLIFTATYLLLGALNSNYHDLRQTISDLELYENGWMQSANFIVFGLFIVLFAIGLKRELIKGTAATLLPILQILISVGLIISGIFIHNPMHTIGSMISFISLVISFFVFAKKFAGDPRWKGWAIYSIASAILMMIFLFLFDTMMSHDGPGGIFEKLAALTRTVWSFFFTLRLLNGSQLSPANEYRS